ncbi:MAG: hypothetical protein FWH38_05135 [Treponema sp.]|nr:hypothetical protein [Treponema sp.]
MDNTEKQTIYKKLNKFNQIFGKLALDITKLSFGSLVLGTIIKGDLPQATLLIFGIIVSVIGTIIGITLLMISEEK